MYYVYQNDRFLPRSEISKSYCLLRPSLTWTLPSRFLREWLCVTHRKLCNWKGWKTSAMTIMMILFIMKRLKVNLMRRLHEISMTDFIPFVEVGLGHKLSGIFVQNLFLTNQLTCMKLRQLLKTGSFPFLKMSSSKVSSPTQWRLTCFIRSVMRQKLLSWMTWFLNNYYFIERLFKCSHMLPMLSLL